MNQTLADHGKVENPKNRFKLSDILAFLIPSGIGLVLFIVPISYEDTYTIPVGVVSGFVQRTFADFLPAAVTLAIVLSFVGGLCFALYNKVPARGKFRLLGPSVQSKPLVAPSPRAWRSLCHYGFLAIRNPCHRIGKDRRPSPQ